MRQLTKLSNRMSWQQRALAGVATVFAALMLTACGNASQNQPQASANSQEAGVLRMASFLPVEETLDPAQGWIAWADTFHGFGESLFTCDENLVPQPILAQEITRVDDLTWKIALKDGILFHNEKPLDAHAVKRSIEYAIAKSALAKELLPLKEMSADGMTLTITTAQPVATMANVLANPVFVVQYVDEQGNTPEIPALTGPFVPSEVVANDHIKAHAFEGYHGGKPELSGVYVQQFNDSQAAMLALESGQTDMVFHVPLATAKPALGKAQGKLKESSSLGTRADGAIVNTKSKYFANNHARQAVAWALDREGYQAMTQGLCAPTYTLFPASMPTLTPEDFKPQVTSYNLDKAREEFLAAGFEQGADGVMRYQGEPVNLRVLTYQHRPELKYMAEHLKSELQKIGVSVEVIETKDFDADAIARGDFDLAMYAMVLAGTGDPAYYYRSSLVSNAPNNYSGYANSDFDQLVDQYMNTSDEAERTAIQKQILETLDADKPYIAFAHRTFAIFMQGNVQGVKAHPSEYFAVNAKSALSNE